MDKKELERRKSRLAWRDQFNATNSRPKLFVLHVENTADRADLIVADVEALHEDSLERFWVLLGGAFIDIREGAKRLVDQLDRGDPDDSRYEIMERVFGAFRALSASLTDDELLWVEYARHRASHPYLDAYNHRFDGPLVQKWTSKTLEREVSLEEADAQIDRFYFGHARDEQAMALHVARKVQAPLRTLAAALDEWATWFPPSR